MDLEKLVDELMALEPDGGMTSDQMRKTLEALMIERPEIVEDEAFRGELRKELMQRFAGRKRRRRIGWVLSGSAAAVLVAVLGIGVALSRFPAGKAESDVAAVHKSVPMPEGPAGLEGQIPMAQEEIDANFGFSEIGGPALRSESFLIPPGVSSVPPAYRDLSGEGYADRSDNVFLSPMTDPFSTFSVDVDTASYANVRRYLNDGILPPAGAVRIEELVNYFDYDYPAAAGDAPFSVNTEISRAPWSDDNLLLRVGLKGREIPADELPPSNLVFLLDVSGSMNDYDKLPLLKRSFELLVDRLGRDDRISIVVYAGAAGVVLEPTRGDKKADIMEALDRLEAGGSTAGGAGIELAYSLAEENFSTRANNRIILATDGDFNVGASSEDALVRMIEEKRASGIFLTVLGFGTGNIQDSTMELLADKGNGNFAYIDGISEARKVLVREMGATLHTIASDVKLQLEFNPARVDSYRLIGYENRMLATSDFLDDTKDAGEIGAGHTVTALYEIVPAGSGNMNETDSRYLDLADDVGNEFGVLALRWKEPGETESTGDEYLLGSAARKERERSEDQVFSAAVAQWGMLLADSYAASDVDIDSLISEVKANLGDDPHGYRAEFLSMLYRTRELME